MNYFKDKYGAVYAYDDEQVTAGYGKSMTPMTKSEINAHENPEKSREEKNADARAYLNSTDWYVIRMQETGEKIPEEVLKKRSEARKEVV